MRLFTEEDVLRALDAKLRHEASTETIERLEAVGSIAPFELGLIGSPDQAKAFAEWLKTGEIPGWRREQIKQAAIQAALRDRAAREGG